MREPSRASMIGRGVAFLLAMALVVVAVGATYVGAFTDRVTVTAELPETGDALVPGSDVKMRGVVVGRVGSIDRELGRPGAIVSLRLSPDKADSIPGGVTARSLPANFFGQSFIDLVPPAQPGAPIRSGARIAANTSAETLELQDVFSRLYRVLTAVEPANLAKVLGALAEALDGRGAAVGDLVGETDAYLRELRPALPELRADLTAFARFAEQAQRQAPSLLDSIDDVLVLARTLVERQEQLVQLLSGGLGLTRNARTLIEDNAARLIRVNEQSAQIIGTLSRHPSAFSDGFVNLGAFLGEFALGEGGRVGINAQLSGGDLRQYTAQDCPRYPGLEGPNCPGGAAAGSAYSIPLYGGIGPIGSVGDRMSFAPVLAALEAGRGSSGDVGLLLAGSVLRGSTVVVPAAQGGSR